MTFSLDKAEAYRDAAIDNAILGDTDVKAEALSMLLGALWLLQDMLPADVIRAVVKNSCEDVIDPIFEQERRH